MNLLSNVFGQNFYINTFLRLLCIVIYQTQTDNTEPKFVVGENKWYPLFGLFLIFIVFLCDKFSKNFLEIFFSVLFNIHLPQDSYL